jgi:TP901 family phage tail tape measure protein
MATERLNIVVQLKNAGAAGFRTTQKGITGIGTAAATSTGLLRGMVGQMAALAATVGAGAFLKNSITTFAEFDDVMRSAGAVTNATAAEMDMMRDAAKEMGKTTRFTASQAADGLRLMGMAGFEAAEATAALPDVLNLAAAGGLELGTAADIATNVLSGFGLEVENLGQVNDVLAKTFTSSNTTLQELGESFKLVGPIAKGVGADFEELLAAIGKLGDAGLKGTLSGTALRGAINALLNPTNEEAKLMEELAERIGVTSLQVKDADGNFVGFTKIIQQLEDAGLKGDEALKLFGQRAGPAMAALLQVGSSSLQEMTDELKNAGGTADRISKEMEAGIGGAMREAAASFEAVKIAIGEAFGEDIKRAIQETRDILLSWVGAVNNMKENGTVGVYAEGVAQSFNFMVKAIKIAYHEVDSFTKLMIASAAAITFNWDIAREAWADYTKESDAFLESRGLIRNAAIREKEAVDENIAAIRRQIDITKEKIAQNKEDLNGWRAKILGAEAYQRELAKNEEKLSALEGKLSELGQQKADVEAKIVVNDLDALSAVGKWSREAGKAMEDAAKPSGPIGKGQQRVIEATSNVVSEEKVRKNINAAISTLRAQLQTEGAVIESEYSQGLLSLDQYFAEREALIRKRIDSELAILRESAASEDNVKKKEALNARIFSLEQDLERSIIELETDKFSKMKDLEAKRAQDQEAINAAKLKAEATFNDQKERLRDVGQGLDVKFQEELAQLQERQAKELEVVRAGLDDEAKLREFYRNQELEKRKLLEDQEKRLMMERLETASSVAGSLSDVFGSVYEATGKKQKEFFYAQKAAAVAQATINIAQGITKAWSQGGIFGAVGAATVAVAGALQISKILSAGYAEGGEVKGSSPHSKADNIPARLTAGEYVQPVSTVQYYGKGIMEAIRQKSVPREVLSGFNMPGIKYGSSHFATGGAVTPSSTDAAPMEGKEIKIINYVDRAEMLAALATPDGADAVVNVISSNREKVSRVLR